MKFYFHTIFLCLLIGCSAKKEMPETPETSWEKLESRLYNELDSLAAFKVKWSLMDKWYYFYDKNDDEFFRLALNKPIKEILETINNDSTFKEAPIDFHETSLNGQNVQVSKTIQSDTILTYHINLSNVSFDNLKNLVVIIRIYDFNGKNFETHQITCTESIESECLNNILNADNNMTLEVTPSNLLPNYQELKEKMPQKNWISLEDYRKYTKFVFSGKLIY